MSEQNSSRNKYVRFVGTSDLINFGLPLQKHEGWPMDMNRGSKESSASKNTILTWH
jgi:hypothetical protein